MRALRVAAAAVVAGGLLSSCSTSPGGECRGLDLVPGRPSATDCYMMFNVEGVSYMHAWPEDEGRAQRCVEVPGSTLGEIVAHHPPVTQSEPRPDSIWLMREIVGVPRSTAAAIRMARETPAARPDCDPLWTLVVPIDTPQDEMRRLAQDLAVLSPPRR